MQLIYTDLRFSYFVKYRDLSINYQKEVHKSTIKKYFSLWY